MSLQEKKRSCLDPVGAGMPRHFRTVVALSAVFGLAACANNGGEAPIPGAQTTPIIGQPKAPSVGLVLPLSGRFGAVGQRMRDAAKLALSSSGAPALDVQDSNGVGGAAFAAQTALSHGDALLLGPLTSADTAAVAPVAAQAGKPVLAFTSDSTQARPGVWVMGLTPEQQVRRMVDAARATGRKRFAAFLPDNPLGHAMADGLKMACHDASLNEPQIVFHTSDAANIQEGLKGLSGIAARQPSAPVVPVVDGPSAIDPTAAGGASVSSPVAPGPVAPSATPSFAPPPFDALLLGDTGLELAQVISALQDDHIDASQVQIMGPALWKAFDTKLGALHGAWFAAPDARDRNGYIARYKAVYGQPPSPVTDFAYDAAALANVVARTGTVDSAALIRGNGFMGVDGLFRLRPDGHVSRNLAVFQIRQVGGSSIVVPASRDVALRPS
ncbi:amino acid ABC transporter substrate-binding protein [Neokomagataea tanensis NBRC 106556]|uniref:Amino acid ABC transporter substrate-binding protein n=1 Tax=Neokomagataea tanensis NBRC 106556 TaxID=1223519 RepID=A0ABQ0QLP8_9PROT|nr:amino acid ABC transporter substrate-binding protein [Neokomagataea tanensis NBRC 106556]